MNFESLIAAATEQGASDLHLEPSLPAAVRIRGSLRTTGQPLPGKLLLEAEQQIIGKDHWPQFLARRSYDLSRTIHGVRCRINIMQTARGIGMAVRLLTPFQATIEKLNLHPDLIKLIAHTNGLILVCGPTGCGKSSTMAALLQEINLSETRHVVTIESPIEYVFKPRRAYIRQREVGRDTPSFDQALIDAMREDPDVLMVGEMREPETMRLTLNASETGHLVLATIHSSTVTEALQRIVAAFPSESQNGVCAQLADCLVAVICQRLHFRPDLKIQLPECEILIPTFPIKNFIRRGEFFKIMSSMETGADQGMWTFARYRTWMEARKSWYIPSANDEEPDSESEEAAQTAEKTPPLITSQKSAAGETKSPAPAAAPAPASGKKPIDIEPVEGGLNAIISKLGSE